MCTKTLEQRLEAMYICIDLYTHTLTQVGGPEAAEELLQGKAEWRNNKYV
jgi:hypothetical protein